MSNLHNKRRRGRGAIAQEPRLGGAIGWFRSFSRNHSVYWDLLEPILGLVGKPYTSKLRHPFRVEVREFVISEVHSEPGVQCKRPPAAATFHGHASDLAKVEG